MPTGKRSGALSAALASLATVASLAACSGSSGPSVAACTKAYPTWFAASAAAQKTTATPDACKGLTEAQIDKIAAAYLAKLGQS